MLLKGVDPWWYDGASLSHAQKNVLRVLRRDIEPVRVIERAGVNTDNLAETFKAQVELGPAVLAEVDLNIFAAASGDLLLSSWRAGCDREVAFVENGLSHIRAAGRPLAEAA